MKKCEIKGRRNMTFGFENLEVWNKAVDFAVKVLDVMDERVSKIHHPRLIQQIEASSTSIGMNIAEGKGRFSKKEFIHHLYISRGSLYETITLLEIMKRKEWVTDEEFSGLARDGFEIASMLKGLINSIK
jgi:four helix bundle protein